MLLFIFLIPQKTIVIASEGTPNIYLDDDTFEIHWIHSIEKEEWYEVYEVTNDELLLTTTYFKTFGAGVPHESEEESEITADGFIKYTVNDTYEDIYLNISDNVETKIVQGNEEFLLYEMYEPYTAVEIKVAYKSKFKQLTGG